MHLNNDSRANNAIQITQPDDRQICDYPVCSERGSGHPLACGCRSASAPPEREAPARVDDLTMLIRQLAHALKRANPNSQLPARAADYLRRKGLQGSPFREEPSDVH